MCQFIHIQEVYHKNYGHMKSTRSVANKSKVVKSKVDIVCVCVIGVGVGGRVPQEQVELSHLGGF